MNDALHDRDDDNRPVKAWRSPLRGSNRPGRTAGQGNSTQRINRSAAVARYAALIAAGRRIFEPGRYRSRTSK